MLLPSPISASQRPECPDHVVLHASQLAISDINGLVSEPATRMCLRSYVCVAGAAKGCDCPIGQTKTATMATIGSKARQFWHHPAGPKTIHFWAPTFKWGISIANIADFKRPVEQVSYPQQVAVTATGVIWSRFATQINPVGAHSHSATAIFTCFCMQS